MINDENNVVLKVGNVVALPELYWEHGAPHAKFTYVEIKTMNVEQKPFHASGVLVSSPDGHYIPNFTAQVYQDDRFLIVRNKFSENG